MAVNPLRDACAGIVHELRNLIAGGDESYGAKEARIRRAMKLLDPLQGSNQAAAELRVRLGALFDALDDPGELVIGVTEAIAATRALHVAS